MTVRERVELWQQNAATEFLREGTVLLGNRKHKFNFFTRYTFDEGPLKGLFVGGGYRYLGKMAANFSDEILQYSKSRGEADLLLGYRLPEMRFLPNGARIQLNVRNLFDATEPHIARFDPNNPGVPSRGALVEPRTWRITTSFDF
jgi:outer membrane receptor protein involved in Fe transport